MEILQRVLRPQHGVPRPELPFLVNPEYIPSFRERCLDGIGSMADDNHDPVWREAFQRDERVGEEGLASDRVEHFGNCRAHALPFPRGQNDSCPIFHQSRISQFRDRVKKDKKGTRVKEFSPFLASLTSQEILNNLSIAGRRSGSIRNRKGGAFVMALSQGASGWDYFMEIVTKPDNIPIVGMLVLVLFFTWIALRQGLRNDRLIKEGKEDEIPEEMWK